MPKRLPYPLKKHPWKQALSVVATVRREMTRAMTEMRPHPKLLYGEERLEWLLRQIHDTVLPYSLTSHLLSLTPLSYYDRSLLRIYTYTGSSRLDSNAPYTIFSVIRLVLGLQFVLCDSSVRDSVRDADHGRWRRRLVHVLHGGRIPRPVLRVTNTPG